VLAARLLKRGLDQEPDRVRAEAAIKILTPREREVTRLTAAGKTNHEIAYKLGISGETVKSHIRSTLAKLGLHSKADLRLLVQTLDPGLVQTLDPGLVQTLNPGLVQTLDPELVQTLDPGLGQGPGPLDEGSEPKR
jgi:DNA-binding CsgD family transcriptional regulator